MPYTPHNHNHNPQFGIYLTIVTLLQTAASYSGGNSCHADIRHTDAYWNCSCVKWLAHALCRRNRNRERRQNLQGEGGTEKTRGQAHIFVSASLLTWGWQRYPGWRRGCVSFLIRFGRLRSLQQRQRVQQVFIHGATFCPNTLDGFQKRYDRQILALHLLAQTQESLPALRKKWCRRVARFHPREVESSGGNQLWKLLRRSFCRSGTPGFSRSRESRVDSGTLQTRTLFALFMVAWFLGPGVGFRMLWMLVDDPHDEVESCQPRKCATCKAKVQQTRVEVCGGRKNAISSQDSCIYAALIMPFVRYNL